jgi:hypothetical protein
MSIQAIGINSKPMITDEVQPFQLQKLWGLVLFLVFLEAPQEVGTCIMTTRVLYLLLTGHRPLSVECEQQELNTNSQVVLLARSVPTLIAKKSSSLMVLLVS